VHRGDDRLWQRLDVVDELIERRLARRPAPVITIAPMPGSAPRALAASDKPLLTACDKALTGGWSMVTRATSPMRFTSTTAMPSSLWAPLRVTRAVRAGCELSCPSPASRRFLTELAPGTSHPTYQRNRQRARAGGLAAGSELTNATYCRKGPDRNFFPFVDGFAGRPGVSVGIDRRTDPTHSTLPPSYSVAVKPRAFKDSTALPEK
jgi:hypothetical protein